MYSSASWGYQLLAHHGDLQLLAHHCDCNCHTIVSPHRKHCPGPLGVNFQIRLTKKSYQMILQHGLYYTFPLSPSLHPPTQIHEMEINVINII